MARYTGPVCKICRRERQKLCGKGERCFSDKCSLERRNYPPGQHGQRRGKTSGYGDQLREKQKVKRIYGVLEKQFRRYFSEAERQRGITGETLLSLLERRLDNVVFRLGFACSRRQSRQLVRHNHIVVNGKRVNIPSFLVKVGDTVEVSEKSRKILTISESLEAVDRQGIPPWLELNKDAYQGKVVALPERKDVTVQIRESLIVELYSR